MYVGMHLLVGMYVCRCVYVFRYACMYVGTYMFVGMCVC